MSEQNAQEHLNTTQSFTTQSFATQGAARLKITLDKLPRGTAAQVLKVKALSRALQQRLLSMGIVEGASVLFKGVAPLGDPLQIETMGYLLSLRRSEAAQIEVTPILARS